MGGRKSAVIVFAALALLSSACLSTESSPAAVPPAATPLEVHFIDVGTGDCIWIHTGDDALPGNGKLEGKNIIIDGGDWGRFGRADGYTAISAYLQAGEHPRLPRGSKIDWVILTHPHSDHCGGLYGVLQDYDVANILDPGHDKKNDDGEFDKDRPASAYGRFFKAANNEFLANGEKARFLWGVPQDLKLNWGSELKAEVLWSSKKIEDDDLNNSSIVLRLSFTEAGNDASFLFTGDAEHFVEDTLVTKLGDALRTKVLKAGHHGSNSSTSEPFLRAVRPEHVVVTAGNQKFSGTALPREETLGRIQTVSDALNLGTKVWRTDRDDKTPELKPVGTEIGDDTVVATTDGKSIQIRYADDPVTAPQELEPDRCQANTASGTRCSRKAKAGSKFCWQHAE